MAQKESENKILTYKGKPLMRKGKQIYYGNADDKYRGYLEVEDEAELLGLNISTSVSVQLQTNDVPGKEKGIKKAERDGLYAALDLGEFWLTEILAEEYTNNDIANSNVIICWWQNTLPSIYETTNTGWLMLIYTMKTIFIW